MVRSHAEGDDARFYAIAMQVAAQAARAGHDTYAKDLRDLVDRVKSRANEDAKLNQFKRPVPLSQHQGDLRHLLLVHYPKERLQDMVLENGLYERLERVIREQKRRAELRSYGLEPSRKILLSGPPGTGKTMTASALAGELHLPLFTIQFHSLITKYMGETAAKLRLIFDAMEETRAVYFFDEFDALGGDRGADNDTGEMRRVLNSFLQFIEQDDSDSLIIGATNHKALLDNALFRRFDTVCHYELPAESLIEEMLRKQTSLFDTSTVDWAQLTSRARGLSQAEITRACQQAAKDMLLDERDALTTKDLFNALDERQRMRVM